MRGAGYTADAVRLHIDIPVTVAPAPADQGGGGGGGGGGQRGQAPTTYPGWTAHKVFWGGGWEAAKEANGQTQCDALAMAALRLLLWHWLQPALYYVVFFEYWGEIDGWQVRQRACVNELMSQGD